MSGATELRTGNFGTPTTTNAPEIVAQLTVEQLFDSVAISVDGPRAWDLDVALDFTFTDEGRTFRVTLRNGVLVYIEKAADPETAQASLSLTKPRPIALVAGDADSPGVKITGDSSAFDTLRSVLTAGDPGFDIVTP